MLMLDLFAGLGGASAAMRDRGWEVVTLDIDPKFRPTVIADAIAWHWDGAPIDLVWASPPCPEFSRWGMPWLRAKFPPPPDMRLVLAAIRIIRETKPYYFVVENVAGSVPFISPLLGSYACVGPLRLWGQWPRLVWPKTIGWKERLSSADRAKRAKIPYAVSETLAIAIEKELGHVTQTPRIRHTSLERI